MAVTLPYLTCPDAQAEGTGVEAPVTSPGGEHNIYVIWRRLLEENEKIAKARLAAVQVYQENISEDAKNLRSGKNLHAKKALDRLQGVQKDVQASVAEVQPFLCTDLRSLTGGWHQDGLLQG